MRQAYVATVCGWALALGSSWALWACGSDSDTPPGTSAGQSGALAASGGTPGGLLHRAGAGGAGVSMPALGEGSDAGRAAAPSGMAGAGGTMVTGGRSGRPGRTGNAGRTAAGSGGMLAGAGAGTGAGSGGSAPGSGSAGAAGGCVENLTCQLPALPSTGEPHQDCVDRINQFRTQCACLPALARWNDGEACADQMAQYDSGGTTAHAGFAAGICKGGSAQNECPGWPSTDKIVSGCLQQMWNEGPPPSNPCNGDCFQTYGHFINMTNTRYTKVACGYSAAAQSKLWSVQNFSQ
jgi:hypothetical protein